MQEPENFSCLKSIEKIKYSEIEFPKSSTCTSTKKFHKSSTIEFHFFAKNMVSAQKHS